jgi:hypothetical protein
MPAPVSVERGQSKERLIATYFLESVDNIQRAVFASFQPSKHRQDPLTRLRGLPI